MEQDLNNRRTMTMKTLLQLSPVAGIIFLVSSGVAQPPSPAATPRPPGQIEFRIQSAPIVLADLGGDQQDPAYATYKKGYALILNEQWKEARKLFEEVLAKYPNSEYRSDAEYWSAYALRHLDRKKAVQAYENFLAQYQANNRYFDDAMADLAALEADAVVAPQSPDSIRELLRAGKAPKALAINGFTPDLRGLEHSLRQMGRSMRRSMNPLRIMRMPMPLAWTGHAFDDRPMSPQTKLKADALMALGEIKEDDKSFQTLREVALDQTQDPPLRMIAMRSLTNFRKFDVLPVFVEVAKKDTNQAIQSTAIVAIGEVNRDKDKSLQALTDLFYATPKHRTEQLETILDAVAQLGNEHALNFLAGIARQNDYGDVQSSAIDYISQAGKDKNRSVELLGEIYTSIPRDRQEPRATVIYSVADIGNDRAVEFLIKVARTDPNFDLRSDAIYYLGNIGGDKARAALYDILKGK